MEPDLRVKCYGNRNQGNIVNSKVETAFLRKLRLEG